ncbi:MAG TPA: cupin domain-containing protein [Burkholderiales bacterium]|nr:cupin domain-containing protein [Burkholderiales bacterium]
MDEIPDVEPQVQHVYDFARLDRVPEGQTSLEVTAKRLLSGATLETGKSSTVGAVLSGQSIICTLGRQAAGTGAKAHSHSNEQFNYILQGTMMSDIEGDRVFARKGCILHTPGSLVHTGLACPDDDLVFFAIKDARHGIVGPPVDGKYDGPNCFPGFGSRAHERRISTADAIEEAKSLPPGPGKRYVYDMRALHDENAGRTCSADVVPDTALSLPHGVSGKLLTGERLHVCVLTLEPRTRISNYRADNEQLVFAAEGELEAMLEDEPITIPQYCVLHIPAGARHEIEAPFGATVVVAQDRGIA